MLAQGGSKSVSQKALGEPQIDPMKPDHAISQRGFAMLESIKRECGITSEPEPPPRPNERIPRGQPNMSLAKDRKPHKPNPNTIPREGEIRLKEFLQSKAMELEMTYHCAWERFEAGAFKVSVRRVNQRVIFVRAKE
jgi:hypothetical protein